MLSRIIGSRGNSYITWVCDHLNKEYKTLFPVTILFVHPWYYYPIKENLLRYNLDITLSNFYVYFASFVGIEEMSKDIYLRFWEKAKSAMGKFKTNTLVIIPAHDLHKEALEFIKTKIEAKRLILAGDPNSGDYEENWGKNYLKDFSFDLDSSFDMNPYEFLPKYIAYEVVECLDKMNLAGLRPYNPHFKISVISGEVKTIDKIENVIKENEKTLIVLRDIDFIRKKLFGLNIPYAEFGEEKMKIPIMLFKYIDTLKGIESNRMISNSEIMNVIRLTRAEVTEKFGKRKMLKEIWENIKEIKGYALGHSSFFEYLVSKYKKNQIGSCLIDTQISFYNKWKDKLENPKWINPNVFICKVKDVKYGEFDCVITERFEPKLMWRVLMRAKNKVFYLE